jgi:hypothetical protein
LRGPERRNDKSARPEGPRTVVIFSQIGSLLWWPGRGHWLGI